jgi:hypothetical protein
VVKLLVQLVQEVLDIVELVLSDVVLEDINLVVHVEYVQLVVITLILLEPLVLIVPKVDICNILEEQVVILVQVVKLQIVLVQHLQDIVEVLLFIVLMVLINMVHHVDHVVLANTNLIHVGQEHV